MSAKDSKIIYAGIGSRKTPKDVLRVMDLFAMAVGPHTILRTGGAEGADEHFEFGATLGYGEIELYVPWEGFRGRDWGTLPTQAAFEVAEFYHPAWHALGSGARRLQARNSHQILGPLLDDPSGLVVCWTPDASEGLTSRRTGGTGQALRIAFDYGIEIKNLANPDHLADIEAVIADAA